MNRIVGVCIFFSVLLLLDVYAFQGVSHLTREMAAQPRRVLRILFWVLTVVGLLGTAGFFLGVIPGNSRILRTIVFGALILNYFPKLVFLVFVFADDLYRLGQVVSAFFRSPELQGRGKGISRSDFIMKTGIIVASIPLLATCYGLLRGAYNYTVRHVKISLPHLPEAFHGLRVVHLSDIHSGSFYNKAAVERGVQLILDQQPDVIFFTGDLVNDRAEEMDAYKSIFSRLKAPMGIFSVLGNHDYGDYTQWESTAEKMRNQQRIRSIQKEMGWDLLINENRVLRRGNDEIALIGIENWGVGFHQKGNLYKANKGVEHSPVKLLLSHDPSHWDAQVRPEFPDIDIQLAGHTHGMQMGIEVGNFKWSPAKWRYKQWGGLYRKGNQYIYVNRGFGFIGFPGRIGMPPEITVLHLNKG